MGPTKVTLPTTVSFTGGTGIAFDHLLFDLSKIRNF